MQFRTKAFPFCPKNSDEVGPGTLQPFTAPIQKLADWFWRVQTWNVTVEMTWNTFHFPDVTFGFNNVAAVTERNLICWGSDANPFDVGIRAFGFDEIDVGGDTAFVDWELLWFTQFGVYTLPTPGAAAPENPFITDAMRKNGDGAYYPQFLFRLRSGGESVNGGRVSTFSDGLASDVGDVILFDGYPVRSYSDALPDIVGITWDPGFWWPYAPESDPDSPIFDINTGERIRANTVSD